MTAAVVHCKRERYDVYIGRPSKWGNPFAIGRDGDRAEVIAKYEAWIRTQPDLMAALPELAGKTLGCWCAPEACHGDVLVRLCAEVAQVPGPGLLGQGPMADRRDHLARPGPRPREGRPLRLPLVPATARRPQPGPRPTQHVVAAGVQAGLGHQQQGERVMRVLVATERTQGDRPDDFACFVPGELVYKPTLECASPDTCGCGRAWAGVGSSLAGTTAMVIDSDISVEDYAACFLAAFARARGHDPTDPKAVARIEEYALEHLTLAAGYSAGTVVGRDGEHIQPREAR